MENKNRIISIKIVSPTKYIPKEWYFGCAELYKNGVDAPEIARQYDVTTPAVYYALDRMRVKRRDDSHAHQRYTLNENFFDVIDNEKKAYWLGFISADGCINSGKKNRLAIRLSAKDSIILNGFLEDVESNKSIYYSMGGKSKNLNFARVVIDNLTLISSLKRLGITPQKSLTLEFCKQVPRRLINSYIRGYFDGDGSIYFDKSGKPTFALVGTVPFLNDVMSVLVSDLGLNPIKIRSKGKISELRYSGRNNALRIRNWLYDGNAPWLQRKKDRFDSIG
jgi:hypothetical protein